MIKVIKTLKNIFLYKKNKHYEAALNLEKKAMNLNIKSEKFVKLAKRRRIEWENKYLK
tara:strand:+ start:297 stop:470 length:174 start_codon:yes stop_codon:yes gene_type:complete